MIAAFILFVVLAVVLGVTYTLEQWHAARHRFRFDLAVQEAEHPRRHLRRIK
jgi:hypothetical protein